MKTDSSSSIGIFDSGIGGLTVAKAVIEALPEENIIYFGDTARVPYGIKSEETVRNYALQITDFLLSKGVKMILIACNTVSASAKDEIIKAAGDIPVLDVITSGTDAALSGEGGKDQIGVIGTLATVNSKAYVRSIKERNNGVEVIQQARPLLVPLAEEGWIDNVVARQTLHTYLSYFDETNIRSLILGCTHYPLFKDVIAQEFGGKKIDIIDSAESIAETARLKLKELRLENSGGGKLECYVSDRPQRFQELAERFLGRSLGDVQIVTLS